MFPASAGSTCPRTRGRISWSWKVTGSFTCSARDANGKRNNKRRRLYMCIDHSIHCSCGKNHASINFKDGVLPHEVITEVYCPECSPGVALDPAAMISDNGWIISSDLD